VEDAMAAGRIQGIAGVFIWTERARFEEMACFYRDRLGLTPRTAKPDFINFDWAGLRLSVSVHDRVQGASRDPFRIMLNLLVDDIAAAHTRLIAAGVVFTRSPETEDWGGRVATFLDPDGNILQLFELPATSAPTGNRG
jgi:catechol 2,3-dioxygenase-like lactoylglutathione lyase family enzyme